MPPTFVRLLRGSSTVKISMTGRSWNLTPTSPIVVIDGSSDHLQAMVQTGWFSSTSRTIQLTGPRGEYTTYDLLPPGTCIIDTYRPPGKQVYRDEKPSLEPQIQTVTMDSGETMCIESMTTPGATRAVLWLPGWNDHCMHPHVVARMHESGFDVHVCHYRGLPMNHKYGNLVDPLDASNHVSGTLDILDEDIDTTLAYLRTKKYTDVVGYGHSLGGLVLANYIRRNGDGAFASFYFNAPFLDWGYTDGVPKVLMRWVPPWLIPLFSYPAISGGGISISSRIYGTQFEWDASEKSPVLPHRTFGFLAAVSKAQAALRVAGTLTSKPVGLAVGKADHILDWHETVALSAHIGTNRPVGDLVLEFGQHDVFRSVIPTATEAALGHLQVFLDGTRNTPRGYRYSSD